MEEKEELKKIQLSITDSKNTIKKTMKDIEDYLMQINNSISSSILSSPLMECKNQLEKTSLDITKSLDSISSSLEEEMKS